MKKITKFEAAIAESKPVSEGDILYVYMVEDGGSGLRLMGASVRRESDIFVSWSDGNGHFGRLKKSNVGWPVMDRKRRFYRRIYLTTRDDSLAKALLRQANKDLYARENDRCKDLNQTCNALRKIRRVKVG